MLHTGWLVRIVSVTALGATMLLGGATRASAQSDAHVAVGAEITKRFFTEDGFSKGVRPTFLYRVRMHRHPDNGWRFRFPIFGFNWGRNDVETPIGGEVTELGFLRARGLMGGVAEALVKNEGRDEISFNVLAGPAFMHFSVSDEARAAYRDRLGLDPISIDAKNTIVVRPGVSYWHDISKWLGFHAAIQYVILRPEVVVRTPAGETSSRWNADNLALKAGIAVKVF
jgi:hypothetical protein